jgi:hypothetical protein
MYSIMKRSSIHPISSEEFYSGTKLGTTGGHARHELIHGEHDDEGAGRQKAIIFP